MRRACQKGVPFIMHSVILPRRLKSWKRFPNTLRVKRTHTSLHCELSRRPCINMPCLQTSSHSHEHVIIYKMISFGLVEAGHREEPDVNRLWSHGWCLALAHNSLYVDTLFYIVHFSKVLNWVSDKWQNVHKKEISSLYSYWLHKVLKTLCYVAWNHQKREKRS